ncbi:serine/threonine-protein kinase STY13-like isoform X2 [Senna tora]|uniref:Serine/threonine-protein kinase STY13-like isoform X2 n=1 Tax=Senna tora TaxID=362788 RepID=A0A835CEB5_9FABA|nr:serine/threonine-protein kinase STY13-like isoform X2 [Senna tora]
MESGGVFYSVDEFRLDAKWLIDPKLLYVGPRIGEGAHGKVYEGKYKNQTVAIKILHKGETTEEIAKREARFAREVAMLSRVQHKNLVKVGIWSSKSCHHVSQQFIGACKEPVMVIVTELLIGGTLRKYLLNMRPKCLDIHVAVGFALDIARAMECLHSHGIIHRDLKPENLLLTEDQKTVKLADFGLAREESLTEMMTAETGTYRWMAPELYSTVTLRQGEKKHYNHKVDAYSFAIVLWELLHNKLPFEGMSNLQAAYAAAFKNVRPSAENLPEELALILTSCWQEDPNARPNFTQIIQMLLNYLYTVSPPEPVIPKRIFASENTVFSPDSPGTSSLMAKCDNTGDTPRGKEELQPKEVYECSPKSDSELQFLSIDIGVNPFTSFQSSENPTRVKHTNHCNLIRIHIRFLHLTKQTQSLVASICLTIPRYHSTPCNNIPMLHLIKQYSCPVHLTTFCIHVKKRSNQITIVTTSNPISISRISRNKFTTSSQHPFLAYPANIAFQATSPRSDISSNTLRATSISEHIAYIWIRVFSTNPYD